VAPAEDGIAHAQVVAVLDEPLVVADPSSAAGTYEPEGLDCVHPGAVGGEVVEERAGGRSL